MRASPGLAAIPVFYRPEMVALTRHFAPGPFKPGACVEDWLAQGLPIELRTFEPATVDEICLAHDRRYVEGVLRGEVRNGFGTQQLDVAATLPFTVGAMAAAAHAALLNAAVACAPVSGFHHAHYAASAGYCTFNGLVVAAAMLQQHQPSVRVGILDLDQHYGDGTASILEQLRLDYVDHRSWGVQTQDAERAEAYLETLADRVGALSGCDVVLYQAGADPHVDDPLGGWMTTEQLRRRDEIVFETCRSEGVALAWNLAGGYQRDELGGIGPVLDLHRNTMQACIKVYTQAWARPQSTRQTPVSDGVLTSVPSRPSPSA